MSEPLHPDLRALLSPTEAERGALSAEPPPGTARVAALLTPTEAELQRLRQRTPARRRRWVLPLLVAAAALAALVFWPRREALVGVEDMVVAAGDEVLHLTPAVVAEGAGTVRVLARDADGARVALDEGRMVFTVDHAAPGHALVVVAGDVEVAVTGTRFAVGHFGRDVQVSVERGSVAVRWPGGAVALGAGQGWSGPPAAVAPRAVVEALPQPKPPRRSPAPVEDPAEAARAWAHILDAREGGAPAADLYRSLDAFVKAHPDSPLAGEAELLRLEIQSVDGDARVAAVLLEHWLRTHPSDPRAERVHLWLATVAAGRLEDCARAAPSFAALASGPYAADVSPYVAACSDR